MKKTTGIWLYIIVGLMSATLLLVMARAEIINPSYDYERGYMDGFRNGMLMCDIDYGTIKLERNGGKE